MKIAIIQDYFGAVIDRNASIIEDWIVRAAAAGADVVAFPECALSGYLGFGVNALPDLAIEQIVAGIELIRGAAAKEGIAVACGTYVRRCGRWYNTALFFDEQGRQLTAYDKVQLVDRDCYHVAPGMSAPQVVVWRDVPISLGICHDIRYPEVLRAAASAGSRLHFHLFFGARNRSDQHTRSVYDAHLCTRAVENGLYIVAPNASLDEQMVRSQLVAPDGTRIAVAADWAQHMLLADIPDNLPVAGWQIRRRDDLFGAAASRPFEHSYFERAWWQQPDFIIDHSLAGLGLTEPAR